MDQAIHDATSTASTSSVSSSERLAYKQASAVTDRIVDKLKTLPRSAAVIGDLTGFRIRLNFGTNDATGVLQFAEIADTEASRDHNGFGVWLEARATVEGIPVCAEVLLSEEAAAVFEQTTTLPTSETAADSAPAIQPVALGDSVLARVPAVTPVAAALEPTQ